MGAAPLFDTLYILASVAYYLSNEVTHASKFRQCAICDVHCANCDIASFCSGKAMLFHANNACVIMIHALFA